MRKITSAEESRKKEKSKRILLSIFLLSILVLSVFGIVIDSIGKTGSTNSGKVSYRGTDFVFQQERWFFSKNGIDFSILNSPENLTEISSEDLNLIETYSGKPLYVYSEDKSLEAEIYFNFDKIASRIQPGCINGTVCTGDFPLKTCENDFILMIESNETRIEQEQNCVFIRAPEKDMQKALDYFFLKITGIN